METTLNLQAFSFLKRLFLILAPGMMLFSCQSAAPTKTHGPTLSANTSQLIVLYAGDLHGRIATSKNDLGGYARLASLIKTEREQAGSTTDVLVISAGDLVDKGHSPCLRTADKACLSLIREIGTDVAVLGNAELYRGTSGIAELIKTSQIPWVNSNVQAVGRANPWQSEFFYRGPKSGAKLWIFSKVRNPFYGSGIPPENKFKVDEVLSEAVWNSWAQKSEVAQILWVNHLKWNDDLEFAQMACSKPSLRNLAFISADDHEQNFSTACAPIAQAAAYGESIGRFVFLVDSDGELSYHSHSIIPVNSKIAPDVTIQTKVDNLYNRFAPRDREVIGTLPVAWAPEDVGNWIARAMRQATHSDIAIVNSGAIKDGLVTGNITREDLFLSAPYNNQILGLDWSTDNLEKSLCAAMSRERRKHEDDGSELYISGGKLLNPGSSQCKLSLDTKRRSVKVVVDSYVVSRSDRWLGRDLRPVAFRFGFGSYEVIERYLKQQGGLR